jgi:hypothetical protein
MSQHDHHNHCDHDLKYCEKCDCVYCKKCEMEWKKPEYHWYPYYPTYPTWQPYTVPWTAGNLGTIQTGTGGSHQCTFT